MFFQQSSYRSVCSVLRRDIKGIEIFGVGIDFHVYSTINYRDICPLRLNRTLEIVCLKQSLVLCHLMI